MKNLIITVHVKSEILDPQGRAISAELQRQGLHEIIEVRQGKQFILKFQDEINQKFMEKIEHIAGNLLSNPVIEDYSIEVKNES